MKKVISLLLSVVMLAAICSVAFTASAADTRTVSISFAGAGKIQVEAGTKVRTISSEMTTKFEVGTTVKLTAMPITYNGMVFDFMYWFNYDNHRIISTDPNYNLIVTVDTKVGAAFAARTDANKYLIRYVDYGGKVIYTDESLNKGTALASNKVPAGPYLAGFHFVKWDQTPAEYKNPTESFVIVHPIYEPDAIDFKVMVTNTSGVTGAGTYKNFDVVTLTAKKTDASGKAFSYWKDANSGEILSVQSTYKFFINRDVTVTAVYGDAQSVPACINVTSAVASAAQKKVTFTAERSVNLDYTVLLHGLMLTSDAKLAADESKFVLGCGCPTGKAKTFNNVGSYSATISATAGQVWYARAYVIFADAQGNQQTVYSDVSQGIGF